MDYIIYLDGRLADALGSSGLKQLADIVQGATDKPVSILTHSDSEFHAMSRFTGGGMKATEAKLRLFHAVQAMESKS